MTGRQDDESDIPEEELWFLPGPFEDDDLRPIPPSLQPASPPEWQDLRAWHAAQNEASDALARLTLVFGELDARLRGASPGLRMRLALQEAADIAWWAGERFALEHLGLWLELRLAATGDAQPALARAGWAVRRLTSQTAPAENLPAFLDRPTEAVQELTNLMNRADVLHPVTQAAWIFHSWRAVGLDEIPGHKRDLEAVVLAGCHAAGMSRLPGQGALFLPLASAGAEALNGHGTPTKKLAAWIRGAERSTFSALLQLDRLRDWRTRATAETTSLTGRVPGLLLDVIETWPYVSASLAQARTGASRAAVQRNLNELAARGLVREVTGQGRFRFWTANDSTPMRR